METQIDLAPKQRKDAQRDFGPPLFSRKTKQHANTLHKGRKVKVTLQEVMKAQ
jgi:hypothetical protein